MGQRELSGEAETLLASIGLAAHADEVTAAVPGVKTLDKLTEIPGTRVPAEVKSS